MWVFFNDYTWQRKKRGTTNQITNYDFSSLHHYFHLSKNFPLSTKKYLLIVENTRFLFFTITTIPKHKVLFSFRCNSGFISKFIFSKDSSKYEKLCFQKFGFSREFMASVCRASVYPQTLF